MYLIFTAIWSGNYEHYLHFKDQRSGAPVHKVLKCQSWKVKSYPPYYTPWSTAPSNMEPWEGTRASPQRCPQPHFPVHSSTASALGSPGCTPFPEHVDSPSCLMTSFHCPKPLAYLGAKLTSGSFHQYSKSEFSCCFLGVAYLDLRPSHLALELATDRFLSPTVLLHGLRRSVVSFLSSHPL